jgi:hypothetical protein
MADMIEPIKIVMPPEAEKEMRRKEDALVGQFIRQLLSHLNELDTPRLRQDVEWSRQQLIRDAEWMGLDFEYVDRATAAFVLR